jgi:hypothetical protein
MLLRCRYAKAISALEELMLLVPQNGFFVLQYAEALYTTSEYSTAYKAFLRVLDMGGLIEKSAGGVVAKGPEVRALWGLKAVSRLIECRYVDRCIDDRTAHSPPHSSSSLSSLPLPRRLAS